MAKVNSDIRPALLKFGLALALSLGGLLYSILTTKRAKPSRSLRPPPASDSENQLDSGRVKAGLEIDHNSSHTTCFPSNSVSCPPDKLEGFSPSSRTLGDDGILLPDFNELVTEFDFSPKKDVEMPHSDAETHGTFRHDDMEDYEEENKNLRNMVQILRERERALEVQLLEYYGLKEQESAVMELQNRLKIHNTEAKLFNIKIDSLLAENGRLEAQVADYAKVVSELETARVTIKLLKKKLKSEAVQNKEQILTLQHTVKKMQHLEHEALTNHQDVRLNMRQLKELQEEVNELRKSNHSLQLENSNLVQKLENTQMLANSVLEDHEAEALKIKSYHLRQQNEDLSKEIERLQTDRCADLEELVYLRWINACLRYELRNFQPGPGKTIARDLSKSLSPKSEEKAKQLIIEYAYKEGLTQKGRLTTDSDFELWSSSYITDSYDFDDSSVSNSSTNKTDTTNKTKILRKLRRLIRGTDGHHSRSPSLEITASADDMIRHSDDSPGGNLCISSPGIDGEDNRSRSASLYSSSSLLDLERLSSLKVDVKEIGGDFRESDSRTSRIYKSFVLGGESGSDSLQDKQVRESPGSDQKPELVKYAEALKDSSWERPRLRRRSASHVSFL